MDSKAHTNVSQGEFGSILPSMSKSTNRQKIVLNMTCQICGNAANDYRHFGGTNVCFSCKAFFRRSVRSPNVKKNCKLLGNCEINFKNRKSCGPCRSVPSILSLFKCINQLRSLLKV